MDQEEGPRNTRKTRKSEMKKNKREVSVCSVDYFGGGVGGW